MYICVPLHVSKACNDTLYKLRVCYSSTAFYLIYYIYIYVYR